MTLCEPFDRGVKNFLNLRGVTEGFLLSFLPLGNDESVDEASCIAGEREIFSTICDSILKKKEGSHSC